MSARMAGRSGRGEAARPTHMAWVHALMGIGLGLFVLLAAFRSTAFELVSIWRANASYDYAWAVIPTLAYLLWHHRGRLSACSPTWSRVGIAGAGVCGVTWLVADLANLGVGRQVAFIAAIPCLVLSAVGWRVFGRLAPFLTLLMLLVPSGDLLLPPLKALTVKFIVAATSVARIPYSFDGNVIFVGANRYVVIDDCAGLHYVLTTLFLGLTFGLLMYRSAWKVGLFALLGAGCGIAANGLRVISIVMFDWIKGSRMELSYHMYFQWVAFALALAVLIAVLIRVTSERQETVNGEPSPSDARAGGRSFLAALYATILAASVPQIALARIGSDDGQGALRAAAADLLPERFAGWTRRAQPPLWSPAPRSSMPYARARYDQDDREIGVFVAATDMPKRKVTGYSIDLVGPSGWLERKRHRLPDCRTPTCREVRALELVRQSSKDVRHVYYVYALGDQIIASALELQLRGAWNDIIGKPLQARIIAVASDSKTGLRAEDVAEMLSTLASADPPR